MSDTLSQFRTRVRRLLKEPDELTSQWDTPLIDQLFNAQYRLRSAQMQGAYEGWFIQVALTDLVADQARYSFPTNFQRLTKIELVRTDGRTIPLVRFERHGEINPTAQTGGDDYNPTWRPLGNGFVLEPASITTTTNGIRLEYEALPVALTATNDQLHPAWPAQLDELLVLDTAIAAFDVEGMMESGQVRSLLRLRQEWDWEFQRFIDRRTIARPAVTPFVAHYQDS